MIRNKGNLMDIHGDVYLLLIIISIFHTNKSLFDSTLAYFYCNSEHFNTF